MKNRKIIIAIVACGIIGGGVILVQKQKGSPSGARDSTDAASPATSVIPSPDHPENANSSSSDSASSETLDADNAGAVNAVTQTENSLCFKHTYQHGDRLKNRDLEDFMNDTNAFPINGKDINEGSICVKVNQKPVSHRLVRKGDETEVIIGSVVGPDSQIQVSYCTGKNICKETCKVKAVNKVDELLNDQEMGSIENEELEIKVKELKRVAKLQGDLLDSTVIREWKEVGSKDWICKK